jgi:hypothetical protein
MMSHHLKFNLKLRQPLTLAAISFALVCACNADTFTLNPFSDAFVATGTSANNLSGDNFGGGGALVLAAPGLPNGEFQTVMQFNLSSATGAFNTQFGAGNWTVQSVTLQLTATPHPNPIYNSVAAGNFNISLMQNNSWTEGTGTAGAPTMDGISFNTLLSTYINNATDQPLGTGSFNGGTTGATSTLLNLTSGLTGDVTAGSDLSLRLYAADSAVSFLFSSRSDATIGNRPELIIAVNAVPEPGSLTLCVMGLAALFLWPRLVAFWGANSRKACRIPVNRTLSAHRDVVSCDT